MEEQERGDAVEDGEEENVRQQLEDVSIVEGTGKDHAFWETQPVSQFKPELNREGSEGPIDDPMTVADVRQEPYKLPDAFEWSSCDMTDKKTKAEVFELLMNNYVEDDDEMFRFQYSQEFLKWALQPPGYHLDWHVGVRVAASKKLVAFITGVPAKLRVKDKELDITEINFLCIHKKLRSKRLAPMLIREITRRVNLRNVWQATYTAGIVLPKPVSKARYYHRSLNVKKLVEIGFTYLAPRMTMSRTIKLYKLPSKPVTPGIREMKEKDAAQVTKMLAKYLTKFAIAPMLDEAEVKHWLLPREGVMYSFVVEDPTEPGTLTDFISFYNLPSTVIKNAHGHDLLKAAYSYYNIADKTPIQQLMEDALILAKQRDFDVFNALDIMDNMNFLKELKFGIGDGDLQYYLYNWRISNQVPPNEIGLVLT